jgi:hypothetical protein
MIRKETGFAMPVTRFMCGRTLVIQTSLPFHELGTAGIPENESFCVSAEIYKEHYGEIYHRLGAWRTEAEMSLIETK